MAAGFWVSADPMWDGTLILGVILDEADLPILVDISQPPERRTYPPSLTLPTAGRILLEFMATRRPT